MSIGKTATRSSRKRVSLQLPASRPNPATYVPFLRSKHHAINSLTDSFPLGRVRRRSIFHHRSRQGCGRAHPHRSRSACARDASCSRGRSRGGPHQGQCGRGRPESFRAGDGRKADGGHARGGVWEQGCLCAHRSYGRRGADLLRYGGWYWRRFEKVNAINLWSTPFFFSSLKSRK